MDTFIKSAAIALHIIPFSLFSTFELYSLEIVMTVSFHVGRLSKLKSIL